VPGNIEGTENVYRATWAALLAVYRHNVAAGPDGDRIDTVAFPLMGAGFGGLSASESARQMTVACRYYYEPPHRLDWDSVTERHRAIVYDDGTPTVRPWSSS
ncbi:MAG: phage tail protein, partial [Planctomycetota bacterium]